MNQAPSLHSIEETLRCARGQINSPSEGDRLMPGAPLANRQLKRSVENLLERRAETLAVVPTLQEIRDWIQIHWDPERDTRPPENTVATSDEWTNRCDTQIDSLAAACKLLLASVAHGVETVAKCAVDFSNHGMIEVRSFYLFKGASISSAKVLDEHCILMPYTEALRAVDSESDENPIEDFGWPQERADNVCALEAKSFEHPLASNLQGHDSEKDLGPRVSPLLQCGPETLGLILGLAWGTGHRTFGYCHSVAPVVRATLPFFHAGPQGRGVSQALLSLPGLRQPSIHRLLNNLEVGELIERFAVLPERMRRVVGLALRRVRDSTERIELEDSIVDLGIALEALFSKGSEDIRETVAVRASWHFSDSSLERAEISQTIRDFYDERSHIVHGNVSRTPAREMKRWERRNILLADVDNVVRASLKSMISEGIPQCWKASLDPQQVRHDPPRLEADIRAVKSDSLSWSLNEQKEIDVLLRAVWKNEVDNAPPLQSDSTSVSHHGISAAEVARCRQQGIPFVISVPIRLFWAHPKWPHRTGDQIDERVKYYCSRDVGRHLEEWRRAAAAKKIYQFTLPLLGSDMYLPDKFEMWEKILSQAA